LTLLRMVQTSPNCSRSNCANRISSPFTITVWPEYFKRQVAWLKKYNRPVICTEFMARPVGSTFDTVLPLAKEERLGAINWGFVAGKTQTYLPWESWQHPYIQDEPPVWFHEVLRPDGTPYREAEVNLIRRLTGKQSQSPLPEKEIKHYDT